MNVDGIINGAFGAPAALCLVFIFFLFYFSSMDTLEQRLQEAKVLETELATLRPDAKIYQRHVDSSHIFFLASDVDKIKSDTLRRKQDLEKQIKDQK
ncbi:hypothetical protein DM01DRAFT_1409337 [Hesseltinella vesiculosa]|uniref:Uncharacterized protein n=1 Tax=Hesseltinella vesiculosa TaxID=101127 RepID=A0A1X2GBG0_9FUNG|nr:hypothetical protein DM01DRAFT_1409337 [Hesseltinella vesiculosa]